MKDKPDTCHGTIKWTWSIFHFVLSCFLLLAGASLGATNRYVKSVEHAIQHYEQVGDYAAALDVARDSHKESLSLGLTEHADIFARDIARLEEKLLSVGSLQLLFDEHFQPRAKLIDLLTLTGMEALNASEQTIVHINNWAQAHLLRQGERWQSQATQFEPLKHKIQPLLSDLKFIDASLPHFDTYQGALVHGGLLSRVRLRLGFLVEQWEKGVRFSDLYFLSGARPLDAQKESEELLLHEKDAPLQIKKDWTQPKKLPQTECEMMQLVWEQSEIPEAMREHVQVHFICAPMKKDLKNDKLVRPTTDDTIKQWLKEKPAFGHYLAVTNAPYTNRQDAVLRALAPKGYAFETIGSGASQNEKMAIYLDELARYIFQIKQLSDKAHEESKEKNPYGV